MNAKTKTLLGLAIVVMAFVLLFFAMRGCFQKTDTPRTRAATDTKTVTEKIRETSIDSTRKLPDADIHRRAWADDDVRRLAADTGAGRRR